MKCQVIPVPKGIDSLSMTERPEPTPGPRQVLVRVHATSLNYRDLLTIEGKSARAAPKPDLIPLSDGAGEVVAVGPGVNRVKTGDRVAGCFMQAWPGGAIDDAALRLVVRRKMYDEATGTHNSPSLRDLPAANEVRLHPLDFAGLAVGDGASVTLVSAKGRLTLPVVADDGVVRGSVTVVANVPGATVNHLLSSSSPVTDVRLEVAR